MSTSENGDSRVLAFQRFRDQLEAKEIHIKTYEFQDFQILGNCSGIYKLKYTYDQGGQHHEKSVIFKIPSAGFLYEDLKNLNIYENEMIMYSVILPEMYKFWTGARLSAKSYQKSGSYDLIMEDLTASGYHVLDKQKQLDLSHSLIALQTLAKFHALSVKLYETSPQIVEMLKNAYNIEPGTPIRIYTDSLYDRFMMTVKEMPFSEEVVQKLQNFKNQHLWKEITRTVSPHDGFCVLSHSDFWTNNIMFKYNDQGEVESAKLIDFQVVHRASPAIDLIQFFVSSVRFEVFKENREFLLKIYQETLNQVLKDLQCQTSYNEDNLKADLETFQLMHVSMISTLLPMILRNEQNSANYEQEKMLPFSSQVYRNAMYKWVNYLTSENIL